MFLSPKFYVGTSVERNMILVSSSLREDALRGCIPTDLRACRPVREVSRHVKMPAGHSFYECANSRTAERTYKKFCIEDCTKNVETFQF